MADLNSRGLLIVIEGLDGAGTTTQQELLGEWLAARRVDHWLTFEPTSGDIGQLLRSAVNGALKLSSASIALLFAADRQEHCDGSDGIAERLERGQHVVCDRYLLSSLAYQARNPDDIDWLLELHRRVLDVDVTIFVDTPPELCYQRILSRGGQVEDLYQEPVELERVFRNYRMLIERGEHLGRLIVIDGTRTIEDVASQVCSALEPLLTIPRAGSEATATVA